MRAFRWASAVLFSLGLALLVIAFVRGEAVAYLVVVFPVIQATGPPALIAFAAIAGSLLLFFASLTRVPVVGRAGSVPPTSPPPAVAKEATPPSPTRRAGGVIFLGPIPIIFGSDAAVARWMILLAVVLFALLVIFWIAVALR